MLITVLALMLVIPGQAYALTNFYFALPAPIDENTLRGANFTVEYYEFLFAVAGHTSLHVF